MASIPASESPSTPIPPKYTFLSLPPEIRCMIYDLLLRIPATINPYPTAFQPRNVVPLGTPFPQVSILGTCRSIYAEASKVFYGDNTFRLNLDSSALASTNPLGPQGLVTAEGTKIRATKKDLIRHIVSGFDMRDVTPEHLVQISADLEPHIYAYNPYQIPNGGIEKAIRDTREMLQKRVWSCKMDVLNRFELQTLEAELTHCYHPNGYDRRSGIRYLMPMLWRRRFYPRASGTQ
ncbi:MAG: hypothetical protein Q9170_007592, partial [Blastenia crenularia]